MSASLQQGKKNGQMAGGAATAAPLLGANSGSSQAALDPMSPQNIAGAAVRQQVQASDDTKYDPDVPKPLEGFSKRFHWPSGWQPIDSISVGISLVLVGVICSYVCMK